MTDEHWFFFSGTVKSEGAAECKQTAEAVAIAARLTPNDDENEVRSEPSERKPSVPV